MAKKRGTKAKAAEVNNSDTYEAEEVEDQVEDAESEEDAGDLPAPSTSRPGPASKKAAAAKKAKTPTKRAAKPETDLDGKRQRKAAQPFQAEVVEPKKRKGSGSGGNKQEYDVECITGIKQQSDGKWVFEIKWKGYSDKEKTWEPKANVANCKQHIKTFLEKAKGLSD